jgi:hypothetical protein
VLRWRRRCAGEGDEVLGAGGAGARGGGGTFIGGEGRGRG